MSEEISREAILRELMKLAFGKCNDAAKLAFLQKEDMARITKMDLSLLDGIHTTSGGVDVRLLDRAKLIELLLSATEGDDGGRSAGGLIAALNGAAGRLGREAEGAVEPLELP